VAGLGLLTCATALLGQFYPLPFPQNYTLLVVCVLVYFLLNTALQVSSPACCALCRSLLAVVYSQRTRFRPGVCLRSRKGHHPVHAAETGTLNA
jgi:hypothetical protein